MKSAYPAGYALLFTGCPKEPEAGPYDGTWLCAIDYYSGTPYPGNATFNNQCIGYYSKVVIRGSSYKMYLIDAGTYLPALAEWCNNGGDVPSVTWSTSIHELGTITVDGNSVTMNPSYTGTGNMAEDKSTFSMPGTDPYGSGFAISRSFFR